MTHTEIGLALIGLVGWVLAGRYVWKSDSWRNKYLSRKWQSNGQVLASELKDGMCLHGLYEHPDDRGESCSPIVVSS